MGHACSMRHATVALMLLAAASGCGGGGVAPGAGSTGGSAGVAAGQAGDSVAAGSGGVVGASGVGGALSPAGGSGGAGAASGGAGAASGGAGAATGGTGAAMGGASGAGTAGAGGSLAGAGTAGAPGGAGGAAGAGLGGTAGAGLSAGGRGGDGGASAGLGGAPVAGGAGASGGGASGSPGFTVCSGTPPAGTRVASIYVIGDSTASVYASDLYPRTGWGQVLGDSFSSACAVVKDKALSGRSSKSFYDEGAWTPVRDALTSGDFVLIQFGHNDEKTDDAARYTDPQTTYKQYLTTYVNDSRAKQAIPVLLTPICRNQWSGGMIKDSHGGYPPAVRELAAALGVPLVNMTVLTELYFERIGESATTALFMNLAPGESPNYPQGNSDNTHLKETGARAVASLFVNDAYVQKLDIARDLAAIPTPP